MVVSMKAKSLSQTNPHLKNPKTAERMVLRSIASSTAIETGESIDLIEQKLIKLRSAASHVTLA
jgi:hypothetical protein